MKRSKDKTQKIVSQEKSPQSKEKDHSEQDKSLCDLVLHSLYENAHKSAMNLESEIFTPNNVKLPQQETQRIWNVLLGSGWVVPCVGFGNAGKLGLSKAGYQLSTIWRLSAIPCFYSRPVKMAVKELLKNTC